jgi:CheY-like chemotaxis protein
MAPQTAGMMLIVDDEPAVVRGLARLFRRDGYTVVTARNGRDALTQLSTQRYDVIVSDLRMPELDGPAFYACLRDEYAYLRPRIIFLTGEWGEAASRTFLAQCGRPWLRKPCTSAMLRSAVQQVLQGAGSAQMPPQAGAGACS